MQKITSLIYKIIAGHPGVVIAVIIASFLMSFGAFSHVEVDEDFEAGISDPQAIATRAEYRWHFGHEQAILLAFDIDGIDRNSLLTAWELVDRIHSWPEVRQVLSILDVLRPFRRADEFAAYLKDFRIRNLVELLQNDRLFRGYLVSDDLKSLQILIVPDIRAPDYRHALYNHLKELQADMSGRVRLHVFGFPYIQERFFEFIVENNRRFLMLGLICCTLLAWYLFPDPLVLGVAGDLYTKVNEVANNNLFLWLESQGFEVWPSPSQIDLLDCGITSAFLQSLSTFEIRKIIAAGTAAFRAMIGAWRIKSAAGSRVAHLQEPGYREMLDLARPYMHNGQYELLLVNIAKIVDYCKNGAAGVINAICLNCMVGNASAAIIEKIRKDHPEVPIVTAVFSGSENPGRQMLLDTFACQVREAAGRRERLQNGPETAGIRLEKGA
ncbi:MAG TPA: hypothetical protein PLK28_11690 [Candidatus Rifleibacterium sp.]|nr:hypothetical protein [Candidatus Rifleibacterium sp.]